MNAIEKNLAWIIVELPMGKPTVNCKWVFTMKFKADDALERDKEKLVAKDFTLTYRLII